MLKMLQISDHQAYFEMVVMVGKVEIVVNDGEWAKKVYEKGFFSNKIHIFALYYRLYIIVVY